ncbi:MAG: S-layer homology domain-containing protein, partial [Clostridiales bacterium]|nr:S-layer homology domain-containing protein [Clostridiales bacterium]
MAAAYVAGYDDGTFLPNKSISRQEASVMLARIVPAYNFSAN